MRTKLKGFSTDRDGRIYKMATAPGGETVQYNDYFQGGDLMTYMHDWFVENGWGSASDMDYPETFYHHIIRQGGIEEVRWRWRLDKSPPEGGGKNFYKYIFNLDVRIVGMTRTEVMRHGMKFKTMKGDIEIKNEGFLLIDTKNEWREHSILKHFLDFYIERMKDQEISGHVSAIRRDVLKFKNHLKNYMKLPIVTPERNGASGWDKNRDFD